MAERMSTKWGAYSETTQARATNMISLSGEQIGTELTSLVHLLLNQQIQIQIRFVFNATTTVIDGEVLDFVELGFEGDLIEIKRFNNLNFSTDQHKSVL